MKIKSLILSLVSMAALMLNSCIEQETTITINKDGSGTIVEETLFSAEFSAMLKAASAEAGNDNPLSQLRDEEQAKAKALTYGEGVELVKIEPTVRNGAEGAKATYKFADINKVNINPSNTLSDMTPDDAGEKAKGIDNIKISYKDDTLTLVFPEASEEQAKSIEEGADIAEDSPEVAMMMQMFKGMKITSKLVVADGIAETNATHREGDTITLVEMNFDELLKNPEGLSVLKKLNLADRAATQEALQDVKGAKFETQEEVTVKIK